MPLETFDHLNHALKLLEKHLIILVKVLGVYVHAPVAALMVAEPLFGFEVTVKIVPSNKPSAASVAVNVPVMSLSSAPVPEVSPPMITESSHENRKL